jgi:hypothetical protein
MSVPVSSPTWLGRQLILCWPGLYVLQGDEPGIARPGQGIQKKKGKQSWVSKWIAGTS